MKTLVLIAVCACGLGMAGTARACDRSLGQQLASASDHLMASVAASLHSAVSNTVSNGAGHAGSTDTGGGNGDVMDGVGTEASTAPPAGDLIGLPAKSAPASKSGRSPSGGGGGSAVGTHDIGSRPPQALGWQSLLPGSIQ